MAVVHFSEEGFDNAKAQGGVLLVDFWATWCGPCKMIAPVIEKLAQDYDGRVTVGKIDVDDYPQIAQQYDIMSIPNVCIFKDGELGDRKIGAMPYQAYAASLDAVLEK